MSPKTLIAIVALAALSSLAAPQQAAAQATNVQRPGGPLLPGPPPLRRRIDIYPRSQLLYRRCVDWYELQDRPSGQVLFPQMRCTWVRG